MLNSLQEYQKLYFSPLTMCGPERSVSWVGNYVSTSFKVKWKVISAQAHRGGVYCQGQSKVTEGKGMFFLHSLQFHVPYKIYLKLVVWNDSHPHAWGFCPEVSTPAGMGPLSPLRGAAQNCCIRQSAQDTPFGHVCGALPHPTCEEAGAPGSESRAAHLCEVKGQCRRERSGQVCVHAFGSTG